MSNFHLDQRQVEPDMKKRYHYDAESDSLYICIADGEEDSFEEIVPGINIEFDASKEPIGIEILNASRFSHGRSKQPAVREP